MASDDKQEEIVRVFLQSWDGVESHYKSLLQYLGDGNIYYQYAQKALIFIAEIRHHEYDQKTHAGTQLSQLILSRAENYGLRRGQHHVRVSFSDTEPQLILQYVGDSEELFEFDAIEITHKVHNVLDRLVARAVD